MNPMRRLVGIALALVLVVTVSSAFIRLSQSGLSCPDWPSCRGARAETRADALSGDSSAYIARVLHRSAASVAGILFLVIAVLGWHRWRGDSRRAASVLLVLLAALLAWLGRYTPSALPAVTLGNLLGGMALLGLLAWLWGCDARGETTQRWLRGTRQTAVLLALVAIQIVLGAAMPLAELPLALAVAYNAVASLLLIVLVSMLPRLRPEEKQR